MGLKKVTAKERRRLSSLSDRLHDWGKKPLSKAEHKEYQKLHSKIMRESFNEIKATLTEAMKALRRKK